MVEIYIHFLADQKNWITIDLRGAQVNNASYRVYTGLSAWSTHGTGVNSLWPDNAYACASMYWIINGANNYFITRWLNTIYAGEIRHILPHMGPLQYYRFATRRLIIYNSFNPSPPGQNGCHFADDIFNRKYQDIFWNAFSWEKSHFNNNNQRQFQRE